jgi:hypothetical protein
MTEARIPSNHTSVFGVAVSISKYALLVSRDCHVIMLARKKNTGTCSAGTTFIRFIGTRTGMTAIGGFLSIGSGRRRKQQSGRGSRAVLQKLPISCFGALIGRKFEFHQLHSCIG